VTYAGPAVFAVTAATCFSLQRSSDLEKDLACVSSTTRPINTTIPISSGTCLRRVVGPQPPCLTMMTENGLFNNDLVIGSEWPDIINLRVVV